MKKIVCIFVFLLYSKVLYAQDLRPIYTVTVGAENQQVVKGLGGGLPWPDEDFAGHGHFGGTDLLA